MSEMYVVSFNSSHHAIRSEKLLKNDFEIMVMPTPREITASCGISLQVEKDKIDKIITILNENNVKYSGVFCIIKDKDSKRTAKTIMEGN